MKIAIISISAVLLLSGCQVASLEDTVAGQDRKESARIAAAAAKVPEVREAAYVGSQRDRECLARAMYFESNRSSEQGMLAVGTVVMNRVKSGKFPGSVCGVVGQRNQFAPGVLSRSMGKGKDLAERIAGQVLKGSRHKGIRSAAFFHQAGLKFPYRNMHYTGVHGGNAFYEKR